MNIVNLTPHVVNEALTGQCFPPCGEVARVDVTYVPVGEVSGIPLFKAVYGQVIGLPEPKEDTVYIVSAMVLAACPDRKDLVSPGDLVRNEEGKVIGCKGFKTL